MQPSTTDLQAAFNRSKLSHLGYTFESAMQNRGLAICLKHLAEIKQSLPAVCEVKQRWYHNI